MTTSPLEGHLDKLLSDIENNSTSVDIDIAPDDAPVVVIDNDQFFNKIGLLHATLRAAVGELGPIAAGLGRTLWHYHHGVWLPAGDDEVRRRCRVLLGQRWRKSHVEGIVADLQANIPVIGDSASRRAGSTPATDCSTGTPANCTMHTPDVPTTYQLGVDWQPRGRVSESRRVARRSGSRGRHRVRSGRSSARRSTPTNRSIEPYCWSAPAATARARCYG